MARRRREFHHRIETAAQFSQSQNVMIEGIIIQRDRSSLRLVGWLMDNKHFLTSEKTRARNWEVEM